MEFENLKFYLLSYNESVFINILILLIPWIFYCWVGLKKKEFVFFQLGAALLILFLKDWSFSFLSGGRIDFIQLIFGEIFFLFGFSWLVNQIYQKFKSELEYYSFFPGSGDNNKIFYRPKKFYHIFTFSGAVLYVLALYLILMLIKDEKGESLVGLGFVFVLILSMENKFYFWKKDYSYIDSIWPHPCSIVTLRLFYYLFLFGFIFLAAASVLDIFGYISFSKNLPFFLVIFSTIKSAAFLSLYGLFFMILSNYKRQKRSFFLQKLKNLKWLKYVFGEKQKAPSLNELEKRNSKIKFPSVENKYHLKILEYLGELLKKTKSEWVYLHRFGQEYTKNTLVTFHDKDSWKNSSDLKDKDRPLLPEDVIKELTKQLEAGKEIFFYNVNRRSAAFRRHFGRCFPIEDFSKIKSLIIYPFHCQGESCSLLLINPCFSSTLNLQPMQKDLLKKFIDRFSLIDLPEKDPKDERPSVFNEEVLPPSISVHQKGSAEKSKEEEPLTLPRVSSANPFQTSRLTEIRNKLFPSTKKQNRFILKTNLEQTYIKNIVKINRAFHPAGNRSRDKILYKVVHLFQDKFQNQLCMAANTGRKGKFFVFNELKQDQSITAATQLTLLNLFYSHLQEKQVEKFTEEWHKGFIPFGEKDNCRFLAMNFYPDEHNLIYFNAGIDHAYHYDKKKNFFSPLKKHQKSLLRHPGSENPTFPQPAEIILSPDDLIVVFSAQLLDVKSREGKELTAERLFDIIRENSQETIQVISKTVESKIMEFAFSRGDNEQILFLSKILE